MWIHGNTMSKRSENQRHVIREWNCLCWNLLLILVWPPQVLAAVGDPQISTDHPWYPGELACSTFERLRATQAEQYKRAVGVEPKTKLFTGCSCVWTFFCPDQNSHRPEKAKSRSCAAISGSNS